MEFLNELVQWQWDNEWRFYFRNSQDWGGKLITIKGGGFSQESKEYFYSFRMQTHQRM